MNKRKDVHLFKDGNVLYMIRRQDSNASDWQHRSSFATESVPKECTSEVYEAIANYLRKERYIEAARLAERYGDHTIKMRSCMDGIRYYDKMLSEHGIEAKSGNDGPKRNKALIHARISELYSIFGSKERADMHLRLSKEEGSATKPE